MSTFEGCESLHPWNCMMYERSFSVYQLSGENVSREMLRWVHVSSCFWKNEMLDYSCQGWRSSQWLRDKKARHDVGDLQIPEGTQKQTAKFLRNRGFSKSWAFYPKIQYMICYSGAVVNAIASHQEGHRFTSWPFCVEFACMDSFWVLWFSSYKLETCMLQ